jgi:hypothetical protein
MGIASDGDETSQRTARWQHSRCKNKYGLYLHEEATTETNMHKPLSDFTNTYLNTSKLANFDKYFDYP